MPRRRVAPPPLPPELWLYIQRLVIEDGLPLGAGNTYDVYDSRIWTSVNKNPLDDRYVKYFLKTALSFGRVCRLWHQLAQELLYENVWIKHSRRWASLSAGLEQPDLASRVRTLRLSTTRFDHNIIALCLCQQVQVVVQPEFPRMEAVYAGPEITLPPLSSLTRIYWTESPWSSALLQRVLHAAPNVKHVSLTSSPTIGSSIAPLAFPNLPRLRSLAVALLQKHRVRAILSTDLHGLTHLTIHPWHLSDPAFSVLPALTALALVEHPTPDPRQMRVPFPAICARCPALTELRYDARATPDPLAGSDTMRALACVRLHLPVAPLRSPAPPHFALFARDGPAFAALERVVLEGPGWLHAEVHRESEVLRARGCTVVSTVDADY